MMYNSEQGKMKSDESNESTNAAKSTHCRLVDQYASKPKITRSLKYQERLTSGYSCIASYIVLSQICI